MNVGVLAENGSLTHWNILADGVNGRVKADGSKVYYLKDHPDSLRSRDKLSALLVQESHDYYPFGLIMPGRDFVSGSPITKELFTGKERDEETSLDYFGARYYDASIGRWLSVDLLAGEYPEWSPYNYTINNPLLFVDRNGKNPGIPLPLPLPIPIFIPPSSGTFYDADNFAKGTKEIVKFLFRGVGGIDPKSAELSKRKFAQASKESTTQPDPADPGKNKKPDPTKDPSDKSKLKKALINLVRFLGPFADVVDDLFAEQNNQNKEEQNLENDNRKNQKDKTNQIDDKEERYLKNKE